jgi:FMN-dependent NADH-azoreductase
MKVLHIDSSILGDNSVSRQVSAAVVEGLRKANPGLHITYRDLAASPLPHVTPSHLPTSHPVSAMAPSGDASALAENRAASDAVLDEFLGADTVVIGAPMYNFTISSQLKTWIDRILVPGKTFRYGANGVEGLAGDKRVIVAIARGGLYGAGTPSAAAEHVETYLRTVLGFIGITNPEIIIAEGIAHGPEKRQHAVESALQSATLLQAA